MDIDFSRWGPLTILAVAVILLLTVGAVVEVCTTPYTFADLINDLKPIAAALGGGALVAHGIRLHGQAVSPPAPKPTRTRGVRK